MPLQNKILTLTDITYPVSPIRQYRKMWEEDKVLYITTYYDEYVIDDKNIEKPSLAERRLIMMGRGDNLYPLVACIRHLVDFQMSKYKKFIDITGQVFVYKKSMYCIIKYYAVKRCREIEHRGYWITLVNSSFEFLSNRESAYVGLISVGSHTMVYELSDTYKDPYRKKV